MTEKHFHAPSHNMKGGLDIDEANLSPDANYWHMGANHAYRRLIVAIGADRADKVIGSAWSPEHTWKEICLAVELLADLAEKQVAQYTEPGENLTPETDWGEPSEEYKQAASAVRSDDLGEWARGR